MKIALFGYGKMGHMIEEVVKERKKQKNEAIEIFLKIDAHNAVSITPEKLAEADVAIDFSTPDAALSNILLCFEAGVPVVVGTTGWIKNYQEAVDKCKAVNGAFLYASNFSIGVNIFFEINKKLAQLMKHHQQYRVQVEETHHIQKLDAPSGTAISIADQIISNNELKQKWVNNNSNKPEELVILSFREAGVPGTHVVEYESEVDTIEIKHTAHSRRGFAEGAVMAAEWIIGKKGVFTMNDVLNLNI